jgi:hypothetical protein
MSARIALAALELLTMRGNSWSLIDCDGNIIRFRPRGTAPWRELGLVSCGTRGDPPVEELRRYEYAPENDADHRHRMLVNFLATIVIIALMVAGSWMVDTIISSWPR